VPNKNNDFKPPVRSIFLKRMKHGRRGIRVIDYKSLMDYLAKQFAEQHAT
jgi:hypothetical protein